MRHSLRSSDLLREDPARARAVRVFSLAAALLLSLCLGCSYSMQRYREAAPDAPRLYVQTLGNDTSEAGVELIFTESLRREVLRRGGMRLVSDAAAADYRLKGRVADLETWSRSFSSTVLALEYTVIMSLDLDVRRRDGEEIPLDRQALYGSEVYLTSADVEAGRKNRLESLRRVSDVLASRVVDALDQVAFR